MSQNIHFSIKSMSALLMHSDRLADPLDPDAKELKALTSKRKKTDEDHELIKHKDWKGALYYRKDIGPYMPGINIKACLVNAAKLNKLGQAVKRGVVINEMECALNYKGPRDIEDLYQDDFVDTRSVVVGTSRLMRTRPIFQEWALEFSLIFSDEILSLDDVLMIVDRAGKFIGLGDYRPDKGGPFGTFEVKKYKELN